VSVDADAEGAFESGLIAAGYLATHEDEYLKTHWRVLEESLFDAAGDFPRIITKTFPNGPPVGVEEQAYVINLATFDRLIVARKPVEATALLAPSGKSLG
jgi:hypothetical protein